MAETPAPEMPNRTRGTAARDAATGLMVILLIAQAFSLIAALVSFLNSRRGVVLPAAVFSGAIFLVFLALSIFLRRAKTQSQR